MSVRALPPAKLLAVVAPVSLVGVGAYLAATFVFASDPGRFAGGHSMSTATVVLGAGAFLLAWMRPEGFPAPGGGGDASGVSLGFVSAVAALVLFGGAPATFVYAPAPTVVAVIGRNPPIRTLFNAGAFG